tara:strand:+ start:372 stop:881 length:510 start_codon:yes stop_codon:yes gene_type:complete
MGLKADLIKAKVQGAKAMGVEEQDIPQGLGSQIEVESELIKEAIVNFLTKCQFRITQLTAPVILEDFKIGPQLGDVQPTVQSLDIPWPGGVAGPPTPAALNPSSLRNGIQTKEIDVDKSGGATGLLESTGYTYIGGDPDSQGGFDVTDLDGIRDFTAVELFREDIEDLL